MNSNCGFHLGTTPDGLISCKCCGDGLLEIKCPYKYRDVHPCSVVDKDFCLQPNDKRQMLLSNNHPYFYQIQGQLAVCNREYCDFIVWTTVGVHVERIPHVPDVFESLKPLLNTFFQKEILPLLLRGENSISHEKEIEPEKRLFCHCQKEEYGRMIGCDNKKCKIEWFHYKCVGISRKPKGQWFCSDSCKNSVLFI